MSEKFGLEWKKRDCKRMFCFMKVMALVNEEQSKAQPKKSNTAVKNNFR
jgi:hypothetical protein